jgi:hypothetical protein
MGPFAQWDRHLAGRQKEHMTGKMPVLLSVATADEVTCLCRLQPRDANTPPILRSRILRRSEESQGAPTNSMDVFKSSTPEALQFFHHKDEQTRSLECISKSVVLLESRQMVLF